MIKKILPLVLLLFSLSTFSQNLNIRVDITSVERFYKLMEYIEKQKGSKLVAKYGSIEQMKAAYYANSKDTVRQGLIEDLLETRPYSHHYMYYVKIWGKSGKDAYRVAFNMIGDACPIMTANMPRSWVKFWNSPKRKRVDLESIYAELNSIKFDQSLVLNYLPKDGIDKSKSFTVYFTVDGNRGAYQEDSIMVLDLMWSRKLKVNEELINIIAHELHHICYQDWMEQNITTPPADSSFRKFQISFIKEGTAQYLNYPDYPKVIKKLYSNRKLLKELSEDIESGDYSIIFETEMKRLKKYLPIIAGLYRSHRPSALYYLSYNIYRSIENVGGKEMLDYVIENPKELISTYNRLYDEKTMNFEPFSEEFTKKWRENL